MRDSERLVESRISDGSILTSTRRCSVCIEVDRDCLSNVEPVYAAKIFFRIICKRRCALNYRHVLGSEIATRPDRAGHLRTAHIHFPNAFTACIGGPNDVCRRIVGESIDELESRCGEGAID